MDKCMHFLEEKHSMEDKYSKEDILDQIGELAESYVPQWRYRGENVHGDVGSALAVIFGEMLYDNRKKYNLLFQKNKIAFFNQLHADLLPARAASGYVTFGLAGEDVPGEPVRVGTRVAAEALSEEQRSVSFEVRSPVLVSSAKIEEIYQVSEGADYLRREEPIGEQWSVPAFSQDSHNQQVHEIYICHRNLFHIMTKGRIEIRFLKNQYELIPDELAEKLTDLRLTSIKYYSADGFREFDRTEVKNGVIVLEKGEGQPGFERYTLSGVNNYWIVIRFKDAREFRGVSCFGIRLNAYSYEIPPQIIHGGGYQCDPVEYRPFGRKMGIYQEVVFGSREVLSKTGARVHLKFRLEFEKYPLETNSVHKINWKWRMKESDFEKEPEYEISIGEVLWEYYTVNGWSRLFRDGSYKDLFSFQGRYSPRFMDMEFRVPEDIARTVINSVSTYYIRARILSMNNEYKSNGYYITPIVSETTFDFAYEEPDIAPQYLIDRHSLEAGLRNGRGTFQGNGLGEKDTVGEDRLYFVKRMDVEHRALYLGFGRAPVGGPIKILFQLKKTAGEIPYPLKWEYYSEHGFKELNVTDETENFRKTGIVTLTGRNDFRRQKYFGKELYWIRIMDIHDYYEEAGREYPHIIGIFINAARARACRSHESQRFRISRYEINHILTLAKGEILSMELWIDESNSIEEEKWVLWKEVPDFLDSAAGDRHYTVDAYLGIVTFGDGIHGKVPTSSERNNVRVEYRTGGGAYTNVGKHRINKLERSMGFINRVTNPLDFMGGCDREKQPEAMERTAAGIKHRNQAVTLRDYEEIAVECSGAVQRAVCFPHKDETGDRKEGMLTLCVIQKDYEKGYLNFEEVKRTLLDCLKEKMSRTVVNEEGLRIVEPVLLKIGVDIRACTESFDSVFEVKEQILERLQQFLHPLHGNVHGRGFEIGEIPDMVRIKNTVASIPGITGIPYLELTYGLCRGDEETEADLETVQKNPYLLASGGNYIISVIVG